jgi:hypothetical protein
VQDFDFARFTISIALLRMNNIITSAEVSDYAVGGVLSFFLFVPVARYGYILPTRPT